MPLQYNVGMRIFLLLLLFPFFVQSQIDVIDVIEEHFVTPDMNDFDFHRSCILETSGTLCAAFKGGSGKGCANITMKENVGIWLSFYNEGSWSTPSQIVESKDSVCWGPVLAELQGELLLFYRIGKDPRHSLSFLKRSKDEGKTWGDAEMLPAGIVGPTNSKPLFDSLQNMICGSSVEIGEPEDFFKATACYIEIYSPLTGLFSKYGPLEIPGKRFGCIEPSLFWTQEGTLKMLCRDRSQRIKKEGWIWSAESSDQGKTWTTLEKTDLPNPDSGVEVLSLGKGQHLLFYNHSPTNRFPLTLALSQDDGKSWDKVFDLEQESGEFPSAVLDTEGNIHVIYAFMPKGKTQRRIKHLVLRTNLP